MKKMAVPIIVGGESGRLFREIDNHWERNPGEPYRISWPRAVGYSLRRFLPPFTDPVEYLEKSGYIRTVKSGIFGIYVIPVLDDTLVNEEFEHYIEMISLADEWRKANAWASD